MKNIIILFMLLLLSNYISLAYASEGEGHQTNYRGPAIIEDDLKRLEGVSDNDDCINCGQDKSEAGLGSFPLSEGILAPNNKNLWDVIVNIYKK